MTEKEIFNGILRTTNNENNVLYFEREIEDIETAIMSEPKLAGRFIDLDENKNLDIFAKNLIDNLKHHKIPENLPQSNHFKFKVKWAEGVGISMISHKEYITQFGETFYEQVKNLIDKNMSKSSKIEKLNEKELEMAHEVLDHARFCNQKVSQFHGRIDLLDKVN